MTVIENTFGEYGSVQKTVSGQETYTTPPLVMCLSNLGDICFFYLFNIEFSKFFLKPMVLRHLKIGATKLIKKIEEVQNEVINNKSKEISIGNAFLNKSPDKKPTNPLLSLSPPVNNGLVGFLSGDLFKMK